MVLIAKDVHQTAYNVMQVSAVYAIMDTSSMDQLAVLAQHLVDLVELQLQNALPASRHFHYQDPLVSNVKEAVPPAQILIHLPASPVKDLTH